MRRIFWIVLLIFIGILSAAAIFQEVRDTLWQIGVKISEPTMAAFTGLANVISANPIYQTYHPLLWMVGGIIVAIGLHQLLWNRKPIVAARDKLGLTQKTVVREEPRDIIMTENATSTKKQEVAPVE